MIRARSKAASVPHAAAAVPTGVSTPVPARLAGSPLARTLLLLLAVASLCVAAVGVLVPGLPSTEFVLLAAWAAARSSPRLHAWLHRHRWFGPALRNWHDGRRVTRRAKYWAAISMTLCAMLMIRTVPHAWLTVPAVAAMIPALIWIWRRPEP